MNQVGKLELLTRLGFAARGLMYIVIGYLAFRLGRAEDPSGALEYLTGRGGSILLAIMAVGLLGYGVWRLSEAAIDTEGRGTGAKGLVVRASGALSGIIHLGLGFYAAKLAAGSRGGASGSSEKAEAGAQTALSLPGGETLLLLAAALLLAVGVAQFVKALKAKFLRHLDGRGQRPWIMWVGRIGYAARGVIFLIAAYFLWQAGRHHSPEEAGGLKDALSWLSGTQQSAVAVGLLLFGIFSLVEARYRRINDPAVVERLTRKAREIAD